MHFMPFDEDTSQYPRYISIACCLWDHSLLSYRYGFSNETTHFFSIMILVYILPKWNDLAKGLTSFALFTSS